MELIAFIHGWAANKSVFEPTVEAIANRAQCLLWELPGHGAAPCEGGFDLTDFVDRRMAQIEPGRKAHIVGWSMGGLAALIAGTRHPDKVASGIFVSSFARYAQGPDFPEGKPADGLMAFARKFAENYEKSMDGFLSLQAGSSEKGKALARRIFPKLAPGGAPKTLIDAQRYAAQSDLRPLARAFDRPALVIYGQRDRVVPPAMSLALARDLPRAQTVAFEKAGHAPFLSDPDEFVEVLLDFVRRAGA